MCDKHTLIVKKEKKVSFFENGYTGDHICSYCGRTIVKGKIIPKLKLQKPKVKLKYKKNQIIVTYKKVAQATRYEIQIKMKKKWKKHTTRKTKYKIKKLVSGKRYKIRVRAVFISKNKVAHSKYKTLKTKKIK